MYYYVYDEFVSDKKYERELIAIENRLADLGIAGRVARLALFRNADALIADELKRGTISTVVVVGDDKTVNKVIDTIADHNVAFGIIPLGQDNHLAKVMGIPNGVAAVDILSARNLEVIDTGRLNGQRFITGVCFPKLLGRLTCDGKFTITPKVPGVIEIHNLACKQGSQNNQANPTDGLLEAVISVTNRKFLKASTGRSLVGSKEFELDFDEFVTAYADGKEVKGSHFTISIEPLALKVITGKDRLF